MAFPLIPVVAGLGALLFFGKKKGAAGPASPQSPGAVPSPVNPVTGQQVPIAERMAVVLASGNPPAIRFEAGRLRQEGYPTQAAELEREAGKLEQQAAAQQQQAGAAAAHAVAPPVVVAHPPVQTASPGQPQPPQYVPQPVAAPPVVIQTPAGPVSIPQIVMPQPQPVAPPIVVQTPAGPVSIPAVLMPQPAAVPPVVIQTPAGPVSFPQPQPPVAVPQAQLVPLPPLLKGEVLTATSPGQTYNLKTLALQNKLLSLGLLTPADVIGKYGPKTTAAVSQFQLLANTYLKALGKGMFLPTAGVTVTKLTVDGKWGNQSNDMAALAHPPKGSGTTATIFGFDMLMAPSEPQPASPLPGVIPPMAPQPIAPEMALAARLAANLSSTAQGQEDRNLVQLFQASRGMKSSGYYGPDTAWGLTQFGFVPPTPRYWPTSGRGKAKRNYKRALIEQAGKEPQRAEEWKAAAASVV